MREGATTPSEIVQSVYTDVPAKAHPMAERAVLAHLTKLERDGYVRRISDNAYAPDVAASE
ncbi:MAG: hypothetical protein H0V88_08740 [Pyrinomonadaceae bacterium]|nr:hypothetical protein [Pyrinomonadaceae bacterium]